MLETIKWIEISKQLPDDEMVVLIHTPQQNEPVWLGYYDQGRWYYPVGDFIKISSVTHWAEVPAGPKTIL
jgi:hypothetical protein